MSFDRIYHSNLRSKKNYTLPSLDFLLVSKSAIFNIYLHALYFVIIQKALTKYQYTYLILAGKI